MSIDRAKLEESIAWSKHELACFTDRPVHNVEAARKTQVLIDAAEAHLATLPKVKMVEVWRVEFALANLPPGQAEPLCYVYHTRQRAEREAEKQRREPALYACIRVTGPHQQEVPA